MNVITQSYELNGTVFLPNILLILDIYFEILRIRIFLNLSIGM